MDKRINRVSVELQQNVDKPVFEGDFTPEKQFLSGKNNPRTPTIVIPTMVLASDEHDYIEISNNRKQKREYLYRTRMVIGITLVLYGIVTGVIFFFLVTLSTPALVAGLGILPQSEREKWQNRIASAFRAPKKFFGKFLGRNSD